MKIEIKGVASVVLDKRMNKFMSAMDLCPPYKAYATLLSICYVIELKEELPLEELKKLFDTGISLAHTEFGEGLVFCHIQSVKQNDIEIHNVRHALPYCSRQISLVSDGEKEGLVVNYLKRFCEGIVIEEGDVRRVVSLSWPAAIAS